MIYRLAEQKDIPAIWEIYRPYVENTTVSFEYEMPDLSAFTARFEGITRDFPWYVAEENGVILGYAYASRAFERRAYAWDADLSIYISENAHGQGIGRHLYEQLEEDLKTMGYIVVYALVTGKNTASQRFHERMGYTLIAELPGTGYKFGQWLSIKWYEKRLSTENPRKAPLSFREIIKK